jgi:hypothetical protein
MKRPWQDHGAAILTAVLAAHQYVVDHRYQGCRMLDKFIAACEASERAATRSWSNGPIGIVNGIWVAAMVSMLWIASPIFAVGAAVMLLIVWRLLGWTKAHSTGFCIGAMLTLVVELSLFFVVRSGRG